MIYKYVTTGSIAFENILKKHEVYFSPPSKLNDPFEVMRNYTLPSKTKLKRYLIKKGAKHRDLKQLIETNMELLRVNKQTVIENASKGADIFGILCMTPYWDNLLMWSHYGDSHKGVCFGFDIDLPSDAAFGKSYQVEYNEICPNICLIESNELLEIGLQLTKNGIAHIEYGNNTWLEDMATRMSFSKSKCWSYESEIRFVRIPQYGGPGCYNFPTIKLKEIILGVAIEKEKEDIILNYKNKFYKQAKLIKLHISNDKYELIQEVINQGE